MKFVLLLTIFKFLGMIAEEVLYACDENTTSSAYSTSEMGLANPAVHFFRYNLLLYIVLIFLLYKNIT